MKVICKCCHRAFDYDMYMGLCPKCGRVYRRGKGVYSAVEKDMVGDFHLHAEEGGLNRGIQGVVYNQGSSETGKTRLNGFDMDGSVSLAGSATASAYGTTASSQYNNASSNNAKSYNYANKFSSAVNSGGANNSVYATLSPQSTPKDVAETIKTSTRNGYYAPNHKTKMNQAVVKDKKPGTPLALIIFMIILIISILSSIFE
ncbi:hypothetical protein SAMN06297422_11290 [Lachnospiraceae bacterium]|nr:hypothetical protein SAMN06297422_11290 [Lachnospiraceae bacterium]